ncbi:ABC1 kinase family protein [Sciscionella marina]|uniref:ABC1 kinase family protein n=1 Tax=Sciscionella marina TaxID=508770 RepID=UPI000687051D|nr:AarF/UbiB family protein [Sciscionella marina]
MQRTARLASLPFGVASRVVGGFGRRIAGGNAEQINAEISAKTAEQLFTVLGQLKGGAMKVGQLLSVFEAAVPEDMAAPYREALTKLQSAAPPMPFETVQTVLTEQLGTQWRERFTEFTEEPVASASIGQVHRAVYRDGRTVAVKVQYPGADAALYADLRQLQRFSKLIQAVQPGVEVKPLLAEIQERVVEELDYRTEANYQRAFTEAFAGDELFVVPRVVASAPKVLVSEWITGTPLATIIAEGNQQQRDHAGYLLALFGFSSPNRAHLLHADPHPGNFMLLEDGRMAVIDYGAVARMPEGSPRGLGEIATIALHDDPEELLAMLRAEGYVREHVEVDANAVQAFFAPFVDAWRQDRFQFSRDWLRVEAERVTDLRGKDFQTGRMLNLPPEYVLVVRVLGGLTGILCQLGAQVPVRGIAHRWLDGFEDEHAEQH